VWFPVIGFLFMGLMMFLCFRMMGVMMRRGPQGSAAAHQDVEIAQLRREVQQLREEIRRLRDRE
jgi:cell division protein FtsB